MFIEAAVVIASTTEHAQEDLHLEPAHVFMIMNSRFANTFLRTT